MLGGKSGTTYLQLARVHIGKMLMTLLLKVNDFSFKVQKQ